MRETDLVNQSEVFAKFAGNDLAKWQLAVGGQALHATFGWGKIERADRSDAETLTVTIGFQNDVKPCRKFLANLFWNRSKILDLTLPANIPGAIRTEIGQASCALTEHLREQAERRAQAETERLERERLKAERRKQAEKEARAREHFRKLKNTYFVPSNYSSSPVDPLYVILLQLGDGLPLVPEQLTWLESEGVHGPIAAHHELMFQLEGDPWSISRASRQWRVARVPLRAIESVSLVNEPVWASDRKLAAALLTTKGGALRDLKLLDEAETCAKEAVRLQPHTHYAFNLLGGISYDRGTFTEGDQYFQEASRRGATPRDEERTLRGAIKRASIVDRRAIALHLIARDPERFAWAAHYLH